MNNSTATVTHRRDDDEARPFPFIVFSFLFFFFFVFLKWYRCIYTSLHSTTLLARIMATQSHPSTQKFQEKDNLFVYSSVGLLWAFAAHNINNNWLRYWNNRNFSSKKEKRKKQKKWFVLVAFLIKTIKIYGRKHLSNSLLSHWSTYAPAVRR